MMQRRQKSLEMDAECHLLNILQNETLVIKNAEVTECKIPLLITPTIPIITINMIERIFRNVIMVLIFAISFTLRDIMMDSVTVINTS